MTGRLYMKSRTSGTWLKICLFLVGLSSVLVLSGCGGGKPDAVWNISGTWYTYHDIAGTSGEQGPALFTFAQSTNNLSGTTAAGETFGGTIAGTDVSFTWTGSDGATYTYNGTVGDGNMNGTWNASNGQSGTWRALINLAPVVSVAGSWNVFQTVTGSTEQGPNVFSLQESGNSISGTTPDGETLTGNIGSLYVIFTWTASDGTTYIYTGTVNSGSSSMSGTWTTPGGQSGTWRATKNS
jgi:hypothetical protein